MSIEGITREELQLAARNHGMPLEVLRWPVTPVGMHYLLIHYDIPLVGDDWTLTVDGNVGTPFSLTLDELRALPAHEVVATMECAGNGRAKYTPRPLSQPWLDEAIGTGRWRGARLRDVLDRAAPGDGAVEVLFTGLDRGVEGGEEQDFQRSLPLELARADDVILAYELNGAPLPPQHGYPAAPARAGLVRDDEREVARADHARRRAVRGLPAGTRVPLPRRRGRPRRSAAAHPPRALMVPPGIPEFMTRVRTVDAGRVTIEGRAWSGTRRSRRVDFSRRRRQLMVAPRNSSGRARPLGMARLVVRVGRDTGRARARVPRPRRRRERAAARAGVERRRLREQRSAARARQRP